jgi:hypothetical protein
MDPDKLAALREHYDNNSTANVMDRYSEPDEYASPLVCDKCGATVGKIEAHDKFHADLTVLAKAIIFVGDGMDTVMAVMQGEEPHPSLFPHEENKRTMIRLGELAGTRDVV